HFFLVRCGRAFTAAVDALVPRCGGRSCQVIHADSVAESSFFPRQGEVRRTEGCVGAADKVRARRYGRGCDGGKAEQVQRTDFHGSSPMVAPEQGYVGADRSCEEL